ncbi:hypothetical protein TPA0598_04_06730 [Streptomyces lydicamycinicus]|uniref:Uncharacterized protein n=1 Tax=Streptomyces lydicamycinicus TaxID=1546107 RepID=A0A0P4R7T7_9ACTN|nr:hypothetical protein TPA0598_04_06730 [Streptomyces lydicamycinicus]
MKETSKETRIAGKLLSVNDAIRGGAQLLRGAGGCVMGRRAAEPGWADDRGRWVAACGEAAKTWGWRVAACGWGGEDVGRVGCGVRGGAATGSRAGGRRYPGPGGRRRGAGG